MRVQISFLIALFVTAFMSSPVTAQATCDEATLIDGINNRGFISLPAGCNIQLSGPLPVIDGGTVTVAGNGATLNAAGNEAFRIENGNLSLTNLTVENALSTVNADGGRVNLTGVTLVNNDTGVNVRGGFVLLSDSYFTGNFVGVRVNDNRVQIGGSVFVNNIVGLNLIAGTAAVNNSTFAFNERGITLQPGTTGRVDIRTSTIAGSSAEGVNTADSTSVTIDRSLIANNGSADVRGAFNSGGYNLLSTANGANFTPQNDLITTPGLAPFTGAFFPLTADSAALDAIPVAQCPGVDQRGMRRPQGAGCDIGAIEMTLQPVTGEIVEILPPPPPMCNVVNDSPATGYALPDGVYCRVLMQDGGWMANPGTIPQGLVDNSVILAVDVFRIGGGALLAAFDGHTPVCLRGTGRLIYLDAATSPRTLVELDPTVRDGSTCGFIPNPGTLVLIEG